MAAKTNKKKSTPAVKIRSVESSPDADVDKIRDIIFGKQMREYAERFERMEARLTEETRRLFDESEKRLKELHGTLTGQLEKLAGQLELEGSRRGEENEELKKDLQDVRNAMNDGLGDAEDRMAGELQRVSELIDNNDRALRAAQDEFRAAIKKQLQTLRSEKTESSELSSLFGELAARLSGKEQT